MIAGLLRRSKAFPAAYDPSRLGAALDVGESWQGNPTLTFSKGVGSGCSDPPAQDSLTATPPSVGSPYSTAHIQLISDPTFVQVVQGRYAYCTGNHWYHNKSGTYTAKNKVWFRQVVKFEANQYTTRGTDPSGANSHKLMFLTWAGGVSSRMEFEFSNTDDYTIGGSQTGRTFTPTLLSGQTMVPGENITTEWTGGQWWEYILNYEIRTAGANGRAISRHWRRRLTSGGVWSPGTMDFTGWWWDFTGGTAPAQAGGYSFWGNRNRSTDLYPDGSARPVDGSDPFHVYYGPFEVVDGEQNDDPYGLQGTGE